MGLHRAPGGRRDRVDGGVSDDVLTTVVGFVREVIEDDLGEEPIGLETRFSEDLELESIEFVALAERLQEHYGEAVDFVGWISSLELDRIIALQVGDLVRFIRDATG